MIKKSILFPICIGIGLFVTACGFSEIATDTYINQNQAVLESSQSSDEMTQSEGIIPETSSNDSENLKIDYSYVDIVFNNMDVWNEYEGKNPYSIDFFTYSATGDTGVAVNYIVGRMAVQRNYFFQNDTIVLDEDGSVLQGGIQDDYYEKWNNSATDEEKYEQLKSIYAGHFDKKNRND